MTMEKNVHDRFDRLELWLEETKTPNQYCIKSFHRLLRFDRLVEFSSPDPERFPVPSPKLLALHAACCKVAHMSGAAEYLDKYDRDLDDLHVLASDGTSFAVLDYAIWEKLSKLVDVGA